MVKISCEGETSLEVLSHLKGFASLIGPEVKAITGTMPEDIVKQATANPIPSATQTSTSQVAQASPIPAVVSAPAVPVPAPMPPVAPIAQPVQPPVTVTPQAFTHEQVGKAGADLVAANPAMMPTLMGLLQRYGVQLVTALKPEQLGPFAGELRALGAKI